MNMKENWQAINDSKLDEKGFIFLDSMNRPYQCRMLGGEPWLCYWNDGQKCFITLRAVGQCEVWSFPHNLSQEEQDMYLEVQEE